MKSFIRDLIEYNIQSEELPSSFIASSEFCLNDVITLENPGTKIKYISKVTIIPKLNQFYNIKNNSQVYENKIYDDNTYFYEFILNWKIDYVDLIDNVILSANGESNLSSYITLNYTSPTPLDAEANIFIDDVNIELISSSSCLLNFTGIIVVED